MVTYAVPPRLLECRLPPGLTLEKRDGVAFVSLVAFNSSQTRVFGASWPGYRTFAELNLRCYVQSQGERGFLFLREFVARRLVAWIARGFYNEPYRVAPLSSQIDDRPQTHSATYLLKCGGCNHTIHAVGKKPTHCPDEGTESHYFKEQRWGYGVSRKGTAWQYKVEHPCWNVYPIQDWHVDLNWETVYGYEWSFLHEVQPASVIFAAGSAVKVYPKEPVTALLPPRPSAPSRAP
jgi:uncharacterized protein YqjF (DUF2071 family)